MAKSFPTKTRRAGRFFGSQSRRSKAPRKGQIAGQLSTVGYRSHRCVSISQTRQTLLAPWLFQIPRLRKSPANAVNDDVLPLPLRLNLSHLPEDRSRGSRRGRLQKQPRTYNHRPMVGPTWYGAQSSARRFFFISGTRIEAPFGKTVYRAMATGIRSGTYK